MLRDPRELLGNVRRGEHEIHAARRYGATRHRIVSGRIILRERDPALGFDGLESQRAVGRRAGKDHTDRTLALILRQRLEKEINGTMRRARLRARLEFQNAPRDAQVGIGRNDINAIRLHSLIVRYLADRHLRYPCQELRERAFMLRIEMLHQHERHARIERQMREQLRVRYQPARRGPHTDNRKRRVFARLAAVSHGVVCAFLSLRSHVATIQSPLIEASAGNRG